MSSVEKGSGNNSSDTSSSLAARRARLRGSLANARSGSSTDPQGSVDPNAVDPENEEQAITNLDAETSTEANLPEETQTLAEPAQEVVNVYGVPVDAEPVNELREEIPVTDNVQSPDLKSPLNIPENISENIPEEEPPAPVETKKSAKSKAEKAKAEAKNSEPVLDKSSSQLIKTSSMQSLEPVLLPLPVVSDNALDMIKNIDQSLYACATNLAALQNLSVEQTNVLKSLTQTLQKQALSEIGLNLNSLTESLAAALEPMKSVGELVPVLDQLAASMDGREPEKSEKLSADQLVTSLSDQLSAGLIDPWTFKCAYIAIYPTDHPADLLHRLVELLGTQRLSGDLFRAAYEAVQAAEPPAKLFSEGSEYPRTISDGAIKTQLDALERANKELQMRQEAREDELNAILLSKEQELQAAQEALNEKFEDLNRRYEDTAEVLNNREEEYRSVLESKDMELIEKESELNMLRMQMEELRSQTEDMVKTMQLDMQEQIQRLREEREGERPESSSANSVPQGFFDSTQTQRAGLFESNTAKPLFPQEAQFAEAPMESSAETYAGNQAPFQPQTQAQSMQPSFQAPLQSSFSPPANPGLAMPAQAAPVSAGASQQSQTTVARPGGATPAPQAAAFASQSGSYGSGVRAQVFEVIVRQALAGAPWREICAGPMQVNNISPDEVETEVKRRQSMLGSK